MGQQMCHCGKGSEVQSYVMRPDGVDMTGTCLATDEHQEESLGSREERVIYEGSMQGSRKDGHGILKMPDGAWYEGQFRKDRKSGEGVYHYPTGSSYSGHWRDDMQHGQGRERWADGSTFQGEFVMGEKHGHGYFKWANGCSYDGQFHRNDMHGIGEYLFADGRGYSGEWIRNDMGPSGRMWWADGREYEGEFRSGRKHGRGRLIWPDGRSYDGEWLEGKQHGKALACTTSGVRRYSLWEHGRFISWQGEAAKDHAASVSHAAPQALQELQPEGGPGQEETLGVPRSPAKTADAAVQVSQCTHDIAIEVVSEVVAAMQADVLKATPDDAALESALLLAEQREGAAWDAIPSAAAQPPASEPGKRTSLRRPLELSPGGGLLVEVASRQQTERAREDAADIACGRDVAGAEASCTEEAAEHHSPLIREKKAEWETPTLSEEEDQLPSKQRGEAVQSDECHPEHLETAIGASSSGHEQKPPLEMPALQTVPHAPECHEDAGHENTHSLDTSQDVSILQTEPQAQSSQSTQQPKHDETKGQLQAADKVDAATVVAEQPAEAPLLAADVSSETPAASNPEADPLEEVSGEGDRAAGSSVASSSANYASAYFHREMVMNRV
eukprot:TRINITY_DN16129_c0_g1_i2.p1 TRINITY_DN16129_c0_g1~~TRINITY_DN16129_c0_g1_i2.p1  ORF type:complete len:615 (+),score=129.94 TRINITY_DN16129_c0_g1_i2:64-1908(+)